MTSVTERNSPVGSGRVSGFLGDDMVEGDERVASTVFILGIERETTNDNNHDSTTGYI
jgi:hypothetical protein